MDIKVSILGILLFGIGCPGRALAQPPACRELPERHAFEAGARAGRELARTRWSEVNSCGKVVGFEATTLAHVAGLAPRSHPTEADRCQYAGLAEGARRETRAIRETCDAECCKRGRWQGEAKGHEYCAVEIATEGRIHTTAPPREPRDPCRYRYEQCCQASFEETAKLFRNDTGACLPYTEGAHEGTFRVYKEVLCVPPMDPLEASP